MSTLDEARPDTPRGYFIALDGPDGAGKTTQVAHLADWLRRLGWEVLTCRDPGGTPLGDLLRGLVLDRHDLPMDVRTEMLLYMASRAQLVAEVIRPAMTAGITVISDRYLLANLAYQGYAGGLPIEEVWRVGEVATGGLLPDLTLLIDIPPEVARARVAVSRDRIEDRPEEYRERVRAGFLRAGADYPAPLVLIEGSADEEAVASRLQSEVARALALGPGA